MKRSKKMSVLLLIMATLLGCGIGGTLAWLLDTTDKVTNTFKVGNIQIDLTETTGSEYPMVPGHTNAKDPKVTVGSDSEDCYVFIKVVEENNQIEGLAGVEGIDNSAEKVLLYSVDSEWEPLDGQKNVYYQIVYKEDIDEEDGWSDYILTGSSTGENQNGYVLVNENVTKEMMSSMAKAEPKLTFFAAAVQLYKTNNTEFTPAEAYEQLPSSWGTVTQ